MGLSSFSLDSNNDLVLVVNASGKRNLVFDSDPIVAAARKLYSRFQFFLGEWFYNTNEGLPWFQTVFVKNPNLSVIHGVFRAVLLSVDAVARVDKITLSLDPKTRILDFNFAATMADGRKLTGGRGRPFVVTGQAKDTSSATANGG